MAIDLDVSVTKSSWLVTFNVLLLGIGNLFWIPLSRKIGKRPVILLCTAIFFASSLWAALAKSYGSLFGARLIQGFGASSSEVLAPAVVADLYFVHERGFWVGLCMFMISFGNSLGGIFGGLVANANPNWRWVFWMNVILTGTCFLTAILFAAETNYQRPLDNEGGEGMHPSELEAIRARANSTWVQSLNVTSWYDRYGQGVFLRRSRCSRLTRLKGDFHLVALGETLAHSEIACRSLGLAHYRNQSWCVRADCNSKFSTLPGAV